MMPKETEWEWSPAVKASQRSAREDKQKKKVELKAQLSALQAAEATEEPAEPQATPATQDLFPMPPAPAVLPESTNAPEQSQSSAPPPRPKVPRKRAPPTQEPKAKKHKQTEQRADEDPLSPEEIEEIVSGERKKKVKVPPKKVYRGRSKPAALEKQLSNVTKKDDASSSSDTSLTSAEPPARQKTTNPESGSEITE